MPSRMVRALLTVLVISGAGLLYFSEELKDNKIILVISGMMQGRSLSNCTSKDAIPGSQYNSSTVDVDDYPSTPVLNGLEDNEEITEMSFIKVVNNEYQHNHIEVGAMIKKRMDRIRDYCGNTPHYYHTYNMYNFPELDALWIPSFKSGSSTWRDFLIETINKEHPGSMEGFNLNDLETRRLKTGYRTRFSHTRRRFRGGHISSTSVSFMQVRHPIDRLISLHLSTAILKSDLGAMQSWGIEAIVEERGVLDRNRTRQYYYKQELQRWVRERSDGQENVTEFSEDNPYFDPPHPTFPELIAYIIKRRYVRNNGYDGHWYPATEWGDVCRNKLDYIIKLENNPMETIFLLDKLNLLEKEEFFLHKHNPSYQNTTVKIIVRKDEELKDIRASIKSKYEPWMKQLSKRQKDMLKRIYKEDFYLFNYDDSMLD